MVFVLPRENKDITCFRSAPWECPSVTSNWLSENILVSSFCGRRRTCSLTFYLASSCKPRTYEFPSSVGSKMCLHIRDLSMII